MLCGIVVMMVTVLVYVLLPGAPWEKPVYGLSLFFVLLAELILMLVTAYGKMSIPRAALISVSMLHVPATMGLSLVYVLFWGWQVRGFLILNILLLAGVFLIDASLVYFFRKIGEGDEKVIDAQNIMRQCVELAHALVVGNAGSPHLPKLREIHEDLRFSDNTVLTGEEVRILEHLSQLKLLLERQDEEETSRQIALLSKVVKERSVQLKQLKVGRY